MNLEITSERSIFLNARLNFQKLNTEMTALVSELHSHDTDWCQSSFINKSSSFEFCGDCLGVSIVNVYRTANDACDNNILAYLKFAGMKY